MVQKVRKRLSERPVAEELAAVVELLNREHSPVVAEARQRLNELIDALNPGEVVATAQAGAGVLPATPEAFLNVTIGTDEYSIPLYLRT